MVGMFANISIHRRRSQKQSHSHSQHYQCIMCWRVLPLLSHHQTHRKRYTFTQCMSVHVWHSTVPLCPVIIQHALSLQYILPIHIPYSEYFSRGVIFSWFSWSRGEPRNIYPRKTPRARAQNRRQAARPRNFFHEIAKITTFTKILPLEKYPLYGIVELQNSQV